MFEPTELMQKLANERVDELNLKDKEILKIEGEYDAYMDTTNYSSLELIYYGDPKAQPRARGRVVGGFTKFYDPAATLKQFVVEQLAAQLGKDFKPISKEIYFTARFYRSMPKTIADKRIPSVLAELGVLRPLSKPDLDNYEKLLYDAVKNVLYTDDGVIVQGHHDKFYSSKPRVEINIVFRK